jgi:hypothetical protein
MAYVIIKLFERLIGGVPVPDTLHFFPIALISFDA